MYLCMFVMMRAIGCCELVVVKLARSLAIALGVSSLVRWNSGGLVSTL